MSAQALAAIIIRCRVSAGNYDERKIERKKIKRGKPSGMIACECVKWHSVVRQRCLKVFSKQIEWVGKCDQCKKAVKIVE